MPLPLPSVLRLQVHSPTRLHSYLDVLKYAPYIFRDGFSNVGVMLNLARLIHRTLTVPPEGNSQLCRGWAGLDLHTLSFLSFHIRCPIPSNMRKLKLNHDKVVGIPKSYWFLLLDFTWRAVKVTKSCRHSLGPRGTAWICWESATVWHIWMGETAFCLSHSILLKFSFMFNPEMFA